MLHSIKPAQYEYNILTDELLIAIPFENKGWIVLEEFLQHEQCQYEIIWQSKYNSYVQYDYAPFCEEGFVKNYYIQGKPDYLEWLQKKALNIIDECSNKRKLLERCLSLDCYTDDLHGWYYVA